MRFDFITIFPRMFDALIGEGVIARGIKQGLLDVRVHDLRDYTSDKHRSTDDEAYGGGPGMVMLAEPVLKCVESIGGGHLIMTTPQGRVFDQAAAKERAAADWAGFGWEGGAGAEVCRIDRRRAPNHDDAARARVRSGGREGAGGGRLAGLP